jgi:hypothetical protein
VGGSLEISISMPFVAFLKGGKKKAKELFANEINFLYF